MTTININSLKEIIEFHGLREKNRERKLVYKRAYLCHALRNFDFTFSFIGELLDLNHATIIHGLKVYESNINYVDFVEYIGELPSDIEKCILHNEKFIPTSKKNISAIEHELLRTTKYGDFIKLKQQLIKLISDNCI